LAPRQRLLMANRRRRHRGTTSAAGRLPHPGGRIMPASAGENRRPLVIPDSWFSSIWYQGKPDLLAILLLAHVMRRTGRRHHFPLPVDLEHVGRGFHRHALMAALRRLERLGLLQIRLNAGAVYVLAERGRIHGVAGLGKRPQLHPKSPGRVFRRLPDGAQWINRFLFATSWSESTYIIAQSRPTKSWGCSCPAWKFRRACRHLLTLGLRDGGRPATIPSDPARSARFWPGSARAL